MKIGIVMAVRNCLELTKSAIESIRTRFPYQVYIIDDHSDGAMKDWLAGRSDIVSISTTGSATVVMGHDLSHHSTLQE